MALPGVSIPTAEGYFVGETPHLPIDLDGDSSFALPRAVSGVVGGKGTADDPYVISGWSIYSSVGHGIRLSNTRAHVLIEGNHIRDGEILPCLKTLGGDLPVCPPKSCFYNAPDCTGQVGVILRNASNVRVTGNRLTSNSIGIEIVGSEAVYIVGNLIQQPHSVDIQSLPWQALEDAFRTARLLPDPYFQYQPFSGVVASASSGLVLENNKIQGNYSVTSIGVQLDGSSATVRGNMISYQTYGMFISDSAVSSQSNSFLEAYEWKAGPGTRMELSHDTFINVKYITVCGEGTAFAATSVSFLNSSLIASRKNPSCSSDDLTVEVSASLFASGAQAFIEAPAEMRSNHFVGIGDRVLLSVGQAGLVHGNVIEGGSVGILVKNASATLTLNDIHSNELGVAVIGTQKPTLSQNCLSLNDERSLWNSDAASFDREAPPGQIPVLASSNWWGQASGPPLEGPNSIYGAAASEPWLPVGTC